MVFPALACDHTKMGYATSHWKAWEGNGNIFPYPSLTLLTTISLDQSDDTKGASWLILVGQHPVQVTHTVANSFLLRHTPDRGPIMPTALTYKGLQAFWITICNVIKHVPLLEHQFWQWQYCILSCHMLHQVLGADILQFSLQEFVLPGLCSQTHGDGSNFGWCFLCSLHSSGFSTGSKVSCFLFFNVLYKWDKT